LFNEGETQQSSTDKPVALDFDSDHLKKNLRLVISEFRTVLLSKDLKIGIQ